MIMEEKPRIKMNPFSKVTTLRGFNNTPDNIRKQREDAHKAAILNKSANLQQTIQNKSISKAKYDPSKQRETIINMNSLNK